MEFLQAALAAFIRTTARARSLLKTRRPPLPSSSASPHHLPHSPQKSLVCLPREEGRRREEEEQRCKRWRELSKSLINLRASPSKEKRRREEEEGKEDEDEVWKGVWRKGREVENPVWGGSGGGRGAEEGSSLWRSRQGEKNQVSFLKMISHDGQSLRTVRH